MFNLLLLRKTIKNRLPKKTICLKRYLLLGHSHKKQKIYKRERFINVTTKSQK